MQNYATYLDTLEKSFLKFNLIDVVKTGLHIYSPPLRANIVKWAEDNIVFDETFPAGLAGPFRIKNVPHIREIVELWTWPTVRKSAIMGCAQFGKTIAACVAWGYWVDQDPSPMLIMQPTDQEVKSFAEQKLERLIDASPILRKKVAKKKRGSAEESSTRKKLYTGGWTEIISGQTRGRTRQRSVKRTIADDSDALKVTKDSEGNQVSNLEKRTSSYKYDSLNITMSTPSTEEESLIYVKYLEGSQGQFYVKCKFCNEEIIFDDEKIVVECTYNLMGEPENYDFKTAKVACPECGTLYDERDRMEVLKSGYWKHKFDYLKKYYPTWHLPEIMSTLSTIERVADQKIKAEKLAFRGDDSLLRSYWNNCKGLPYRKAKGKETDAKQLLNVREDYMNSESPGIPNGVLLITSGVDVQEGSKKKEARLEYTAYGWGWGEECWIVDKKVFPGDPSKPETWKMLDDYIDNKKYIRKDGLEIEVTRRGHDSGYLADTVYEYCAGRWYLGFCATKGANQYGAPVLPRKGTLVCNDKTMLLSIGTQAAKAELYARLNTVTASVNEKQKPSGNQVDIFEENKPQDPEGIRSKYIHFTKEFCDIDFYDQVTAEHGVQKNTGIYNYTIYEKKHKNDPNEALDLLVINFCMMKSLNVDWDRLRDNINAQLEELKEKQTTEEPEPENYGRQRRTEPRRSA